MGRYHPHVARQLVSPRRGRNHIWQNGVALPNQFLDEPVRDPEFRPPPLVEHRGRQPGRLDVQVDDQRVLALAGKVPGKDGRRRAAPHASLDGMKRVARWIPFPAGLADRPPILAHEEAIDPEDTGSDLERRVAHRVHELPVHPQHGAPIRPGAVGTQAVVQSGSQTIQRVQHGVATSRPVLLRHRDSESPQEASDQIDPRHALWPLGGVQDRRDAIPHLVKEQQLAAHSASSQSAIWTMRRTCRAPARCSSTSSPPAYPLRADLS